MARCYGNRPLLKLSGGQANASQRGFGPGYFNAVLARSGSSTTMAISVRPFFEPRR
jgi:hypothetical protein